MSFESNFLGFVFDIVKLITFDIYYVQVVTLLSYNLCVNGEENMMDHAACFFHFFFKYFEKK